MIPKRHKTFLPRFAFIMINVVGSREKSRTDLHFESHFNADWWGFSGGSSDEMREGGRRRRRRWRLSALTAEEEVLRSVRSDISADFRIKENFAGRLDRLIERFEMETT
ncbi:hypothetical protein GWI33_020308 [Rhynchophorus ferrugineus]|uniref:Uncharacterized protein n=1 Tax=Rhynchophorus ferrugineus TaxID=354439 RepID=A0A834HWJ4_RHYFE|nr:hypothetical protein GWI33_020308 [Rhynchophorus ferrugineus]